MPHRRLISRDGDGVIRPQAILGVVSVRPKIGEMYADVAREACKPVEKAVAKKVS